MKPWSHLKCTVHAGWTVWETLALCTWNSKYSDQYFFACFPFTQPYFFGRTQIKRNKQQFSTFQCFLKATNLNIARRGLCSPGCKRKHQLLRYIYRWPAPNEGWIHRKTVWKPASALIKQELERLSGISNSEREVLGTPFRSNLKRLGDSVLLTVSKVKSANLRPMGKD